MRYTPRIIRDTSQESDKDDNDIIFNLKNRRIHIFCKIDRRAALLMQTIIDKLKSMPEKDVVTVIVNTEGGLAYQGLAIYDQMRNSGLNFKTITLGEVASSGLAIVLAGKERLMYRHACLKFHASAMQFGESKKVLEQHEAEVERRWIDVVNKLYDEITMANSNLTVRQIRRLEHQEICLTAEQALKFRLVHKIIG